MAIKKRLTEKERLSKLLPKGWKQALLHPLLKKLTYGDSGFDATDRNIVDALKLVSGWKGATWRQKVFILALDLVMEKAFGKGLLNADTYNRLQDHLTNNEGKVYSVDINAWQVYIWDIYHDSYGLQNMESGDLMLPSLPSRKRKVVKKRRLKKRKLRK